MLSSKRLRLRAIEHSDLSRFVSWLNDPEVTEHLMLYIPMSLPQEEQWYEKTLNGPAEEQPLVIEIDTPEGWTPIGNISLMHVDWRTRSAELGLFIGEKRYWNQRYGGEAIQVMLRHGFEGMNLNRIYLRVFETNPRAIRCYERVGFQHEGRLRQAHFLKGQYIDVLIMSVLRDEWKDNLH